MIFKKYLLIGFALISPLYGSETVEPSPGETEALELINRLRSNPHEESELILKGGYIPASVDRVMFKEEMLQLQAQPPLVFNLSLVKAARNHSKYMQTNDQVHMEVRGKQDFTGVSPSERARGAGFPGGCAENAVLLCGFIFINYIS